MEGYRSAYFLMSIFGMTAVLDYSDSQNIEPGEMRDYCPRDIFAPQCAAGEVILMKHAHIGRKYNGRCSLPPNQLAGCFGDILTELDALCSSKQSCSVPVMNPEFHEKSGCSESITVYLEAAYDCIRATSNACDETSRLINVTSKSGFLVPSSDTRTCDWVITAQPGQRIQLWFYDFSQNSESGNPPNVCPIYAKVDDGHSEVNVCPSAERERSIINSISNILNIHLDARNRGDSFMFKFEVHGCPHVVPPHNGYVIPDGEGRVTVKCNKTKQMWHLVCRGTDWGDQQLVCDQGVPGTTIPQVDFPEYGLVVAVIIGVIIGIICGFAMLATVLLCRRWKWRSRNQRDIEMSVPSTSTTPQSRHSHNTHTVQRIKGDYGLTHVWEVKGQGASKSQGGQGHHFHGHTHTGGRSQSAAGSNSPDSAYLTYQGQLSTAASSTTASSGPGSTVGGANIATLQRGKEQVYESPHMLPDGTLVRHHSPLPCCRQFLEPAKVPVAVDTPVVPHTSPAATRPAAVQPKVTTPVSPIEPTIDSSGSGLSDDTDDDDKSLKFIKKCGYALVPSSPDDAKMSSGPPRERKENHYT